MEFFDEATEQQCYGYVATNPEPIRTLHGAMNLKVEPALLRVLGGVGDMPADLHVTGAHLAWDGSLSPAGLGVLDPQQIDGQGGANRWWTSRTAATFVTGAGQPHSSIHRCVAMWALASS